MKKQIKYFIIILFIFSPAFTTFAVSKKSIDSEFVKISVTKDGDFEVLDKKSGVAWHSNPFGEKNSKADKFDVAKKKNLLKLINKKNGITLTLQLLPDGKRIDVFYESPKEKSLTINLFSITDKDKGYVLLPVRMGLLIPSDNGVAFSYYSHTRKKGIFPLECNNKDFFVLKKHLLRIIFSARCGKKL